MNSVSPIGTGALCSAEYGGGRFLSPLPVKDFAVMGHTVPQSKGIHFSSLLSTGYTGMLSPESCILEGGVQES